MAEAKKKTAKKAAAPEKGTFTDERDGHVYKIVKMGDQVWMAENLDFGELTESKQLKKGQKWHLWGQAEGDEIFGGLYTWDVAKASCPAGWHLPSRDEVNALKDYVLAHGVKENGIKKALRATTGWGFDREGTDKFGFCAFLAGSRNDLGYENMDTYWWLDEQFCCWGDGLVIFDFDDLDDEERKSVKVYGYSVRCVKD